MNKIDINVLLENIQTIADNLNLAIHIEPKIKPTKNVHEFSMEDAINSIDEEYNDICIDYEQKYVEFNDKIATLNDEVNKLTAECATLNDNFQDSTYKLRDKIRNMFLKNTTMCLDTIDEYLSAKLEWYDNIM